MKLSLKELAKWHVVAFAKSKGRTDDQFAAMHELVNSGKAPPEILTTPPRLIMSDPKAREVMVSAFNRVHRAKQRSKIEYGLEDELVPALIRQMTYALTPDGSEVKEI